MRKVAVHHGREPGWVFLRELCGEDEESVAATDSEAAIALLDRILVAQPGAVVGPGRARDLTIADRDRLLADAQVAERGSLIDSEVCCSDCGKLFEIHFDLVALMESTSPSTVAAVSEGAGVYRLMNGRRFRLPRGEDELAVAGIEPSEAPGALLRRCLLEGDVAADADAVSEAMGAVGPLLDVEIGTTCAECGHSQSVRFDLQHYFLSEIVGERSQRAREVHQVAMAYRWSLAEILSLPRARRRLHVALIERDQRLR